MNEPTVEDIHLDISDAQAKVRKADALERLHNNADFKAIVLEGYFKEQAAGLVAMRAHPAMQNEREQANLLRGIDAIGEVQQYFSGIFQQGNMAAEAIRSAEHELEEMEQEGEA